jgi:hypothetical protein
LTSGPDWRIQWSGRLPGSPLDSGSWMTDTAAAAGTVVADTDIVATAHTVAAADTAVATGTDTATAADTLGIADPTRTATRWNTTGSQQQRPTISGLNKSPEHSSSWRTQIILSFFFFRNGKKYA